MRNIISANQFLKLMPSSPVNLAIGLLLVSSFCGELMAQSTNQGAAQVQAPATFQSRLIRDENGIPQIKSIAQCQSASNSANNSNSPPIWNFALTEQEKTNQDVPIAEQKVQMLADTLLESSPQKTHIIGNVEVNDADSQLLAQELLIDHTQQLTTATGNVSIESTDAFFSAQKLTKDEQTQVTQIDDAQFFLFANNANGSAEQIQMNEQQQLSLTNLTFSTCPAGDESWSLNADEMQIDQQEGRGEAWNTVLRVKGVPVFYFPYVNFPVGDQRKSGLLFPKLKTGGENGLDISQPIYWNAAANFDATLTPRYIEKRGNQLGNELRWLTEKTYSQIDFEWLNKDRIVEQQLLEDPSLVDASSSQRWLARIHNQTNFNPSWQLNLNAKKVSDSDYLRDFDSGIESSNQTRLNSEMRLTYRNEIWQMDWFAMTQQSLIGDNTYRYLPSWQTSADYTGEAGLRWQWTSEVTQFEHKDVQELEGLRMNAMPSVSYPMQQSWGFLTPKVSYMMSRYQQKDQLTEQKQQLSRNLPIFSLDSGIFLEREIQFAQQSYLHSLEPRAFYAYVPHREQQEFNNFDTTVAQFDFNQLFRTNRFTGNDRIGDTNQLSLVLGNRFSRLETGEELFEFALGRTYYLAERSVQLDNNMVNLPRQSPWLAQADVNLGEYLSVGGLIEWDDQTNRTNRAESSINFEPKDNHIVNLTHRYRDIAGQQREELDFSFAWSLNEQWRVLGRWYNDVERGEVIESLAGIEYESCCWAIRLVAQKYLNSQLDNQGLPVSIGDDAYNKGIHLQFVFKGLGSVGDSGLSEQLSSSIKGYQDPFSLTSTQNN